MYRLLSLLQALPPRVSTLSQGPRPVCIRRLPRCGATGPWQRLGAHPAPHPGGELSVIQGSGHRPPRLQAVLPLLEPLFRWHGCAV
jgi:hypothetical protein